MTHLRSGDKPLTADERRLVLRFGALIAIPMALIVLLTVLVAFLLYRNTANHRIADNKERIKQETAIREDTVNRLRTLTLHFNSVQRWILFDNCVADEKQDAVIVSVLRSIPPAERTAAIQSGIDALEPQFGDRICTPPSGRRPPEAQP